MTDRITLRRPDDWHAHFRDGAMLAAVVPHTARQFGRAIAMPNLTPPVTTTAMAAAYRERILAAVPAGDAFMPLMTCYLTDRTDPDDLAEGFARGVFTAAKLYPAGATTNSASGVTDIRRLHPVLERMQAIGMPLLIHGEVVDPDVDIFDREKTFLAAVLGPLVAQFRTLKVVLEHLTTEDAVEFVRETARTRGAMGGTITAHHLHINRNAMLVGGIQPHHYCLPVPKRERHRLALRAAATGGERCFFLGTDSAPHPKHAKESACGCAGVYTAAHALELYAEVFDAEDALDRFEAFAAENGPDFYGLPRNEGTITLERGETAVPESYAVENGDTVHPFRAGGTVGWRLADA